MESSVVLTFFAIVAGIVSVSYLLSTLVRSNNGGKRLPPGPWGLPLLGHLHMLGDLPHRNLHRLAKKYGPIMSLRLGLIPTIVVSSPEYAELILKTHDTVFANRPKIQAADLISYGGKGLVFAPYGPYWRDMRKLCAVGLLSSAKMEMFKPMRKEEVRSFVASIKSASEDGESVDVSARVASLVEDMTYRMVFGFKEDRFSIKSTLRQTVEVADHFNLGDHFPFLRALDLQGLGHQMKNVNKILDCLLENIIDEHIHNSKELQIEPKDFIDVMLSMMEYNNTREMHIDRENIKAITIDMLAASMDTTSTAIEWVIAELLKHPRVMKQVQDELECKVGLDRMVEEADLIELEYLKLVIKESMRIHPIAPLLIPHESIEDITINGFFIPKNTRVLINTWAIGRDPNLWSYNAEKFYPERFVETKIDIQGHDFQLLPFGSGRRKCPGSQLGMTMVQLIVAQLVHCFRLKLLNGMPPEDLDMSEKFCLSLPRANHVAAVAAYRLSINL